MHILAPEYLGLNVGSAISLQINLGPVTYFLDIIMKSLPSEFVTRHTVVKTCKILEAMPYFFLFILYAV